MQPGNIPVPTGSSTTVRLLIDDPLWWQQFPRQFLRIHCFKPATSIRLGTTHVPSPTTPSPVRSKSRQQTRFGSFTTALPPRFYRLLTVYINGSYVAARWSIMWVFLSCPTATFGDYFHHHSTSCLRQRWLPSGDHARLQGLGHSRKAHRRAMEPYLSLSRIKAR